MSKNIVKEKATCRGCGMELIGDAYMYGGGAYYPGTYKRCPVNHYGGYVCSEQCDLKVFSEMESQNVYTSDKARLIRLNWSE